jgi:hypothetical protein
MSKRSRLESMRSRILEFEKEIDERIDALLIVETDILNTGSLRKQWLASVSYSVGDDAKVLHKKFQILRAKSELFTARLMIENARMESLHESQTLLYLIAATKPYDKGEYEEKRKSALECIVQDNVEDLKNNINESIVFRTNLTNEICDLIGEVTKLKLEHEQQNAMTVNELQRRILQYTVQLRESSLLSTKNDKEITGDYLVLRHNSRVAKEMLLRSKSDATIARRALQEGINQVASAAASQKDKIEQSSEIELQTLTDVIRSQLLSGEQELEELRLGKIERARYRKQTIRQLTESCEFFNGKHADMQTQRRNDLERVGGELKRLREMVEAVEIRLLKLSSSNDDKDYISKESHQLEKNSRTIIEKLELRLRQLKKR